MNRLRLIARVMLLGVLATIVSSSVSCSSDEDDRLGTLQQGATVPTGFVDELVVNGLSSATAMAFAPDGRLFVCEQTGRLRVVKNGQLLATPFLTVPVSSSGERGLLGVAFDPAFSSNGFVYVYYTATTPAVHNRLSRFTANGDVAISGSETVLLELDNLSGATNHNGGALHFGPDGKLYVAVGENANGSNAQTLGNLLGKMLRLDPDGTIPTDNPFYSSASGKNRAIWALGLRNPFTFAFRRTTGRMFINDVGQVTWEEINDGIAGSNYGWPTTEGMTTNPNFRSPVFVYGHGGGSTQGCAITGGTFYDPVTASFPTSYVGKYFFGDYCNDWIRLFDPSTGQATSFASNVPAPVDLRVGPDGALYYLARGSGSVGRIRFAESQPPTIDQHPANRTVAVGQSAEFTVAASGSQPLSYQWQRNGNDVSGATSATYSLSAASSADNGAAFRAVVSNAFGSATSNSAVLTVTSNSAPMASIGAPATGTQYSGGQTIQFTGTGTDAEDGALPPSAFTWRVDLHHDQHTHPFVPATTGITSGSFVTANEGHTETNVWYRIHLTVRDSAGLTHSTFRDITPRMSTLSLRTNPPGLELTLDGQPVVTPVDVPSVVGVRRTLEAVSPQSAGGTSYVWTSWSDGGAALHTITTPAESTTYTAFFEENAGGGLAAEYFDNANFTGAKISRVDSTIDFDWGNGAPAAGMGANTFSVRWSGLVAPRYSETYTFRTTSDDGVRLWIDGALVIDNWTDHAATENTGIIALEAGEAYSIRMEFYENGGLAVARLEWQSASQTREVVPSSRLLPSGATSFPLRVNFQLAGAPIPSGYQMDGGDVFGVRAGGLEFGWNVDHTDVTRDRNAHADQRLDTLCHFHSGGVWEIAVPNGTYDVTVGIGDPSYPSTHTLNAEGVTLWSGVALSANQFLSTTRTVVVSDGRLTLSQGSLPEKSTRIDYVEIALP